MSLFPRKYAPRSSLKDQVQYAVKENTIKRNWQSHVAIGVFSTETRNPRPLRDLIPQLQEMVDQYPDDLDLRYDLAVCQWANEQLQGTLNQLQAILKQDSHESLASEFILRILLDTQQYKDGKRFIEEKLSQEVRNDSEIPFFSGIIYFYLSDLKKARERFHVMYQKDPNKYEYWCAYIGILAVSGDIDQIPLISRPKTPLKSGDEFVKDPCVINMGERGRVVWGPEVAFYIPYFDSFTQELKYLEKLDGIDFDDVERTTQGVHPNIIVYSLAGHMIPDLNQYRYPYDDATSLDTIFITFINQSRQLNDNHFNIRMLLTYLQLDPTHTLISPQTFGWLIAPVTTITYPFSLIQTSAYTENLKRVNSSLISLGKCASEYKFPNQLPSTISRLFSIIKSLISQLNLQIDNSVLENMSSADILADFIMQPDYTIEMEIYSKALDENVTLQELISFIRLQSFVPFGCDKTEENSRGEEDYDEYGNEKYHRPSLDKNPFGNYNSEKNSIVKQYIPSRYIQRAITKRIQVEIIDSEDKTRFNALLNSGLQFIREYLMEHITPQIISWVELQTIISNNRNELLIFFQKLIPQYQIENPKLIFIKLLQKAIKLEKRNFYFVDNDSGLQNIMHQTEGDYRYDTNSRGVIRCREYYINKYNWLTYGSLDSGDNLVELILAELQKVDKITEEDLVELSGDEFYQIRENISYWDNYKWEGDE